MREIGVPRWFMPAQEYTACERISPFEYMSINSDGFLITKVMPGALAWLAPHTMETVVRGNIRASISLARLKKGFTPGLEEQRKVLGFLA